MELMDLFLWQEIGKLERLLLSKSKESFDVFIYDTLWALQGSLNVFSQNISGLTNLDLGVQ